MKKTTLHIFLLVSLVGILFSLIGCKRRIDISKKSPYKECIGKHFLLRENLYVYHFNQGKDYMFFLGTPHLFPLRNKGLPSLVDEKYIGTKGAFITLKGVAHKGSIFYISSVSEERSFEDTSTIYNIILEHNPFQSEVGTYDIMDILNNPPYTKTWSDPPIFDKEYAEPVLSDGVWWKSVFSLLQEKGVRIKTP